MKILVIHNRYRIRSGEDKVFDQEVFLLNAYGNNVQTWTVDNQQIRDKGLFNLLKLGISTIWSQRSYRMMLKKLDDFKPDIVHVHNIIPLLSPSIFHACHFYGVPIIQTLHNYRLACPVGTYYRDGQVCISCLDKSLLASIYYGCYRNSRLQTAIIAIMLQTHRWLGTWKYKVNAYIVVNQFLKEKIVEVGIPKEKIYVKPNFINNDLKPDAQNDIEFGFYYLFVGRLVEEKGIRWLLENYTSINSKFPLVIVGEGDLLELVKSYAAINPLINYVGSQSQEQVLKWMQKAIALIFPSLWYECCPLTIIEAYSQNLPVIGANQGAISNLVKTNKTGLLFDSLDVNSIKEKISYIEFDQNRWIDFKFCMHSFIDTLFLKDYNYSYLVDLYKKIISQNKNKSTD